MSLERLLEFSLNTSKSHSELLCMHNFTVLSPHCNMTSKKACFLPGECFSEAASSGFIHTALLSCLSTSLNSIENRLNIAQAKFSLSLPLARPAPNSVHADYEPCIPQSKEQQVPKPYCKWSKREREKRKDPNAVGTSRWLKRHKNLMSVTLETRFLFRGLERFLHPTCKGEPKHRAQTH